MGPERVADVEQVRAPPGAGRDGTIAATGAAVGALLALAVAVLTGGAVLLVVRRRRP